MKTDSRRDVSQKQGPVGAQTYLNVHEAAEFLRIKPSSVYALCHTRGFPAIKVAKKWIIRKDRLAAWWDEQFEDKEFRLL